MRLVDEAPTVVGMLSSVIGSGGSLESAVRSVAGSGPTVSSRLMTGVVREADTGGEGGVRGCLSRALESLPPEASGFTRSVGMCVAASSASDPSDADGMMSDASDTALASVAEMGESYGASVTVPCTVVFGLGMMVPLVLMTILPIVGMSGRSVLDGTAVTLVTTVAVPSAMVLVSLLIASRNPFLIRDRPLSGIRHALPLALVPPLAAVHVLSGFDPENAVLFSVAPAAVATAVLMAQDRASEVRTRSVADAAMGSLSEIGIRMVSGEDFRTACPVGLSSAPGCGGLGESLGRELVLCHGDVGSAIGSTVDTVSPGTASALNDVWTCSTGDLEGAGRLAMSLGRQHRGRMSVMNRVETNLRSMTDMMFGTAAVFAPMVLGLTTGMMEPLSGIPGYIPLEGSSLVMGVYLVELCAVVALMTSVIGRGDGPNGILWRFCCMCPVSLLVFSVCAGILP